MQVFSWHHFGLTDLYVRSGDLDLRAHRAQLGPLEADLDPSPISLDCNWRLYSYPRV